VATNNPHARYDEDTALVVVDMQNDFAHPEGSLHVPGGDETIPVVNREIAEAREHGALVVYTQDWHPETTPHFEKDGGIWPTHCVKGSWGAELHEELEVHGPVVRKGTGAEDGYSGFTVEQLETGDRKPTGLDELLQERGIKKLVVVGLAQDVCVKETVLDARRLRHDVYVLRAGTRPVNLQPDDGERAIREMSDAGAHILS
jgi:nicotinamidase/pyrazinamidase